MRNGTVVKHFKRDLLTREELRERPNRYLYVILSVGEHTETGEKLVVYKSLEDGLVWLRPVDMFLSDVDSKKYPNLSGKKRFTEYKE